MGKYTSLFSTKVAFTSTVAMTLDINSQVVYVIGGGVLYGLDLTSVAMVVKAPIHGLTNTDTIFSIFPNSTVYQF